MPKQRTYNEPKKLSGQANINAIRQLIYDYASRGISKRSIAVKLGISYDDFLTVLDGPDGYKLAHEAGVANFEEDNLAVIETILEDPDTSRGLKAKMARENLKTLEAWAPATRSVNVVIEGGAPEFMFESFSEKEVQQIQDSVAEQVNTSEIDDSNVEKE